MSEHFLYVYGPSSGPYKIGISNDVRRRLRDSHNYVDAAGRWKRLPANRAQPPFVARVWGRDAARRLESALFEALAACRVYSASRPMEAVNAPLEEIALAIHKCAGSLGIEVAVGRLELTSTGQTETDGATLVQLRFYGDELKGLDDLRRAEPDLPSRTEMVKRCVMRAIEAPGSGRKEWGGPDDRPTLLCCI